MLRVPKVPEFEGILIHWGNTAADTDTDTDTDTEGCILVGAAGSKTFVGSGRATFDALDRKLEQASSDGEARSITVG